MPNDDTSPSTLPARVFATALHLHPWTCCLVTTIHQSHPLPPPATCSDSITQLYVARISQASFTVCQQVHAMPALTCHFGSVRYCRHDRLPASRHMLQVQHLNKSTARHKHCKTMSRRPATCMCLHLFHFLFEDSSIPCLISVQHGNARVACMPMQLV